MVVFLLPKILITNTTISWNKGAVAQVTSLVHNMRRFIPEVEFSLLSYCPELDSHFCSRYGIKIIGFSNKKDQKLRTLLLIYSLHLIITILLCAFYSFFQTLHLVTSKLSTNEKHIKAYAEADLILDLSGDSFSDWKNRSIVNVLPLLPAILLRKPFAFFSQSMGPFNSWSLPFARLCLNRSSLIVIRENVTKNYLEHIRVKNRNISLAADCAFLLEPAPSSRISEILKGYHISREERPRVGISVSGFMMHHFFKGQGADYLSTMSKIADYVIDRKGASILFIPHSVTPPHWGNDDINAIRGVYKLVKTKEKVKIVANDYDARELKGIIGYCDLFIGCRMHANIAAISQNIPTLALGWSHKYYGIMERVGMEAYVCNLETMSYEEIKAKVDMLFSDAEQTRRNLEVKTKYERESALGAIKQLVDLLSSFQNS